MENFIYNDNFYEDLSVLADCLDSDGDLHSMSDTEWIEVELTSPAPIVELDADWIIDRIDCERFSDNNEDSEVEKIKKMLNSLIDWKLINDNMPKLNYPYGKKAKVTKQDLLDAI